MNGTPKWLEIALGEVGVRESPGPSDNPRVVDYLSAVPLLTSVRHDSTAWCSAFANWCMRECGIEGTRSAAARSWLDWGVPLDKPKRGCIAVLWRGKPDGDFGHVAFYLRDVGGKVELLGGNQGDSVSVERYDTKRVIEKIGYRWPRS